MPQVSTSEILNRAADLLATPNGWTQEALARTASGAVCDPTSPRAMSFCALGALARVGDDDNKGYWALQQHVKGTVASWNNVEGRTQDEVVATFREVARLQRPAVNDEDGCCIHCGRDNWGYEGMPCSDECPGYDHS